MMTQPQLFPVTRELVPENQRLSITEKLFGIHFPLRIEPVVYGITDKMAEDYTGGGGSKSGKLFVAGDEGDPGDDVHLC